MTALKWLAPGFTVASFTACASLGALSEAVGPAGRVIGPDWLDVWRTDKETPANIAFLRFSREALPLLSHSLDVMLVDQYEESPTRMAEERRVLAPGGLLLVGLDEEDEVGALGEMLHAAGLLPAPAPVDGWLAARAPGGREPSIPLPLSP